MSPKVPPTTSARGEAPEPVLSRGSNYVRYGAVAVLVVVVPIAIVTAIVLAKGSGSSSATTTQGTVQPYGPVLLSAPALSAYAADLNQRFYWAGPRKGYTYEFTRTTNDYVYVRYLPKGVAAGTPLKYPFIATYPLKGALASLKASDHGKLLEVKGHKGAVAAVEPGKPTNVRVAYPGVDFQIEVYDPKAAAALALATSGDLESVR